MSGRCPACGDIGWEKRHKDHVAMRKSWRGRRLQACRAVGDLQAVIEELGTDDKTDTLNLKGGFYPMPAGMKNELKKTADSLLHLILIANDGG
jgi:hypothetical protein